ncbi:hypothetical protein PAPYR_10331 [Paratrimastix pyriformis]|uniref:Uncharacterized protein n=1 Tax=Paratrimastix pyriformis TaxID=342808 RepID=A0ABQ8UDG6_9EUKA|nr:hypothetical protein PAPYR_10331 [Paratrimastix pyriformis]
MMGVHRTRCQTNAEKQPERLINPKALEPLSVCEDFPALERDEESPNHPLIDSSLSVAKRAPRFLTPIFLPELSNSPPSRRYLFLAEPQPPRTSTHSLLENQAPQATSAHRCNTVSIFLRTPPMQATDDQQLIHVKFHCHCTPNEVILITYLGHRVDQPEQKPQQQWPAKTTCRVLRPEEDEVGPLPPAPGLLALTMRSPRGGLDDSLSLETSEVEADRTTPRMHTASGLSNTSLDLDLSSDMGDPPAVRYTPEMGSDTHLRWGQIHT